MNKKIRTLTNIFLKDQRFGRLLVIEQELGSLWCKVQCDCGTIKPQRVNSLIYGKGVKSCGCIRAERAATLNKSPEARESARLRMTVHGLSHHPLSQLWHNIMKRCFNPKGPGFRNYGGRGIGVCGRWQILRNFITDIKGKPSPELTLDRKDNDGGYWCGHCEQCIENSWPMNVRWATRSEQNKNRRPMKRAA